ncbi:MAG: D-aminoacylase [Pseudomonadota bacterium]
MGVNTSFLRVILIIASGSLVSACTSVSPGTFGNIVIRNATIVDGTGRDPYVGSVRIRGSLIVDVGEVTPTADDLVVPAENLVLTPGFVDTHSHHDAGLLIKPQALGAISQGITTIVVGQDGTSNFPLSDYFKRLQSNAPTVNVASYTGHNTLRSQVMGEDFQRPATEQEVQQMATALRQDMDAGSFGLGTGLEYDPGIYSETSEVIALARVASELGGRYISHIRSEDRYFWDAVDELISIGREASLPVHMSHAKLAMKSLWGQTDRLIEKLDTARAQGINVTLDVYPYDYWQSTLRVLFPDRDFQSLEAARLVLSDIAPADGIALAEYRPDPTLAGKTLAQIAETRDTDPAQVLLDLIEQAYEDPAAANASVESMLGRSMRDEDIVDLLNWRFANVCSDGGSNGGHPRGFGAFPRIIHRYVKQQNRFTLAQAIRKMTLQSAQNLGISDRGWIGPGAVADLVLFDLNTIKDNANPGNPTVVSSGISSVWVNGQTVYASGVVTGRMPGQVLRR